VIKRNDLSQAQWRDIDDLLPGKAGDRGRTAVDKRIFVNGVLWVLRSGAHWYHMPERYGVSLTIRTNSAPPREGRASPKARPLAPIDQWLVDNWNEEADKGGFGAANPSFRAYSKLEALVEKRVSEVRLSFFDEGAVLTGPPKGYKPTQAWYCPDLLSAIWLQF
jgi:transposase